MSARARSKKNGETKAKAETKAKTVPKKGSASKHKDGVIEFELGGVRVRVKESTVRNVVRDIISNPLVRDTISAVKNVVKPMKDDELLRYLEEQKKKKGSKWERD